ncbi:hypothetical protein ACPA9J_33045 [Pseudomonas aeruginosa]
MLQFGESWRVDPADDLIQALRDSSGATTSSSITLIAMGDNAVVPRSAAGKRGSPLLPARPLAPDP